MKIRSYSILMFSGRRVWNETTLQRVISEAESEAVPTFLCLLALSLQLAEPQPELHLLPLHLLLLFLRGLPPLLLLLQHRPADKDGDSRNKGTGVFL